MKFYVTLQVVEYLEKTVEITAPNPREAAFKAKALADQIEFRDLTDSELNVVSVERMKGDNNES